LSEYEQTLHQTYWKAALHLGLARQRGPPQPRPVSGVQHGLLQFWRRMAGAASKSLSPKRMIEKLTAMKFSTETMVAGAVAVAFAVLSMAVIAGEQSQRATDPTSGTALRQVSAQGLSNSLSGAYVGRSEKEVLGLY